MSFITLFMALTTAFVLLAPMAMAAMLVAGGVPVRATSAAELDAAQGSNRPRT